jgi:hypothetical protein
MDQNVIHMGYLPLDFPFDSLARKMRSLQVSGLNFDIRLNEFERAGVSAP